MKLAIIPNPRCESAYLTALSLAAKVEHPVSGVPGKPKCLPPLIKRVEEVTKADGDQKISKELKELDKAEVAHEIRKAFNARVASHWGALSAISGYPCALSQRICRNYQSQAESKGVGQTVCETA
tara:strand:- start:4060 stop:4434 length:375 start_codon:yes stop_codon:yes gene_type:complete